MMIKETVRQAALAKAREIIGDDLIDEREVCQVADAVAVAVLRELRTLTLNYTTLGVQGEIDRMLVEFILAPVVETKADRQADVRAATPGEPAQDSDGLCVEPPWCSKRSADGWTCTRQPGHEGQHVAGNSDGDVVYFRWPAAPMKPSPPPAKP